MAIIKFDNAKNACPNCGGKMIVNVTPQYYSGAHSLPYFVDGECYACRKLYHCEIYNRVVERAYVEDITWF